MSLVAIATITTALFATEINLKNSSESNIETEPECVETCSTWDGDIRIETSAGNWFMSCEKAKQRCYEKLERLTSAPISV
ncbi:hypothetical protein [Aureivirga marina]|uniref:hypothetical protein n=1 Tax=Aureivirga marina TaxID=1182451 RepID=UPI0018C9919D|nr:hypothetical protein [Aureivirga marina]